MSTEADITLRFAVEGDVPLILAFIKEIAEFERLSHEVTATEESLRDSLFSGANNPEVVLCFLNNQPVAYAVFYHNFSTFVGRKGLYLEDIYVKPEQRHSGIGRKLFKFIAKVAVERNCGRMEWAVLNWNRPAIRFYESMGARPLTEWTLFRLQDEQIKKVAK
jgi:GNAT superfamily N-acetyltransferase